MKLFPFIFLIFLSLHSSHSGFPGVTCALDGTHVKINTPSEKEDAFICRRLYASINIQVKLKFNMNWTEISIKLNRVKFSNIIIIFMNCIESISMLDCFTRNIAWPLIFPIWMFHLQRYKQSVFLKHKAWKMSMNIKKMWIFLHSGNR